MLQTKRRWFRVLMCLSVASWATTICHAVEPNSELAIVPNAGLVQFAPSHDEASLPERFRMTAHPFEYQSKARPAKWFNPIKEWDVTFASPVTTADECNNTVHCEYFAPRGGDGGQSPGVIVLHILGGDFELSRTMARSLAMGGVGAMFVKMPYYGPRRPEGKPKRMISEDLERTVNSMTQAVLDIRRAASWLGNRAEIDETRLGITGVSLGGIVASLAAASEPRFASVCLVLAGGDLDQIIRESVETVEIRKVWATRDFDPEQVRQQLSQVDPLTYAARLKQRRVLMFNAKNDRSIPVECTRNYGKRWAIPRFTGGTQRTTRLLGSYHPRARKWLISFADSQFKRRTKVQRKFATWPVVQLGA